MTLVGGGLTLVLGAVDDVASLGYGANELRALGVALELAPQSAEPGAEYLDIVAVFRPPDAGEQFLVEHEATSIVSRDIASTLHAHPTLSEAIRETAMGQLDGSIHFQKGKK